MMAENYHNIWAKKKKLELEAKGNVNYRYLQYFKFSVTTLDDTFQKTLKRRKRISKFKLTKNPGEVSILDCEF